MGHLIVCLLLVLSSVGSLSLSFFNKTLVSSDQALNTLHTMWGVTVCCFIADFYLLKVPEVALHADQP